MLVILRQFGAGVIVPTAVEQELAAGHDVPEISGVDWIVIRSPSSRPTLPDANQLDAGESDVLWVTLETGAIAVLDEVPACRRSTWHPVHGNFRTAA